MLNTILHYASETISGTNQYVSALGMFFLAALTTPIMSPLTDLTGLSRQIAVLAFQLGWWLDTLSNANINNTNSDFRYC